MLAALLFRALREPVRKSFVALPPLSAATPLPTDITGLRFSLMRALQGIRSTALQQFGGSGLFDCYMVGHSVLQPAIAVSLITHGWVVVGRPHWVEAIVQYRLSDTGLALKNQLEAWWAELTLEQRLHAVLLE